MAEGPNWKQDLADSITAPTELAGLWPHTGELARVVTRYPARVPRYYASLIDPRDPMDPIALMSIPRAAELSPGGLEDPLAEDSHMPVPRLVHRYRDRALLLVTLTCAMYCRFCTRKRLVGSRGAMTKAELDAAAAYLMDHPEIRDVLVSGGDPLTLSDQRLGEILGSLRRIPSVRIIRVATRVPAVLPSRITADLAGLLATHSPLFVMTHFDHPRELTHEARTALRLLGDHGLPMANQTVLLSGVNDDPDTLTELFMGLLEERVRPYYLLQGDLTEGTEHLRTPLAKGIELMEILRGRLSGLALPTLVLDLPHGGGKVPLTPNYVMSMAPGRTVLRNFEGQVVVYPDPGADPPGGTGLDGVAAVLEGQVDKLVPGGLERIERRLQTPEGSK